MNELDFITSLLTHVTEIDVKYAVEAMGGSVPLYEKTLQHMVRQIPSNITEMDDSLNSKSDLDAFAVKIHGIKSALRHVGKMALANAAETMEKAAKAGDRAFCEVNYKEFREKLLIFSKQVNEVVGQVAGSETGSGLEIANNGNINDFVDALKQASEAAETCDSMSAYEILLPLTKIHFGENIDNWVLRAVNALDQFKPFEALDYIAELLNKCEKPQI